MTNWKTRTALLEPATPHPALSRKGRGNDHDHDHDHDKNKDKSFISFWIAAGLQRAPRNDGQNHYNDHGKTPSEPIRVPLFKGSICFAGDCGSSPQ
jgi:hypothetical protein